MKRKEDDKKCITCKMFYHVYDDYGICSLADGKTDTSMVRFDTNACHFYKQRGPKGPWGTTEFKS